jgi:hypothetical protein
MSDDRKVSRVTFSMEFDTSNEAMVSDHRHEVSRVLERVRYHVDLLLSKGEMKIHDANGNGIGHAVIDIEYED